MSFGTPYFPNKHSPVNRFEILRKLAVFLALGFLTHASSAFAAEYQYQLFKNKENFGIVVFPKDNIYDTLSQYIQSIDFKAVDSGNAVMRFGPTNRDNQTYMMPESVQKKHNIEKFIILQVLADHGILVGIYDPKWGLTLPFATYNLDGVKENIPKTLDIFRNDQTDGGGDNQGKTTL